MSQQQSLALSALEHAKYVPKLRAEAVQRLCLCRPADHRVRPDGLFTRRLLCLLSYTGSRLSGGLAPPRSPASRRADDGRERGDNQKTAQPVGVSAVSDSGSRMGAAGRCQVRSKAVTLHGFTPLTCENVVQQQLCRRARSVRIEEVRGQIPSAPPRSEVGFDLGTSLLAAW